MTNSKNSSEQGINKQEKLEADLVSKFSDSLTRRNSLAWKEQGLCYEVTSADSFHQIMSTLKSDPAFAFNMLIDVTCVDWLDAEEKRFEVVYQLLSIVHFHRLCIKVRLAESSPKVTSVRDLWASANFMEREVYDLFGIDFEGHGDLRRILMYDEFVGHPLRKDYPLRGKQPRVKLRVPELRNTSADLSRDQLVSLPTRRG
jgi:NADH-quinone oxidoreductase subunit C